MFPTDITLAIAEKEEKEEREDEEDQEDESSDDSDDSSSDDYSEDETDEGYDFNILSTVATDIGPRIGVADRPSQTTLGWVSLDMIIYE